MTDDRDVQTEWENSFRCPHCGGLNDLAARWCMQCSKRLAPEETVIDMGAGAPELSEIVAGGLDVVAGGPEVDDEGISEAFVVAQGSVSWTCGACGHPNPIAASSCSACGRTFADSARRIADALVPQKQNRSTLKALGILSVGAVGMRLVAGLISPWAALALFGGILIRWVIRFLRSSG